MLKVTEYSSLEELLSLRTEWDTLLDSCEHASIFAKWEWADAYFRYRLPTRRPIVLAVRDDRGTLVGILPLSKVTRFGALQTVEVLGCTKSGYPISDYGGPIAVRGMESAMWQAILAHLKKSPWAIIDFRNCPEYDASEGHLLNMVNRAKPNSGWLARVQTSAVCRVIPLPNSFDAYLATLSSNTRQNLRRKLRKLREAGYSLEEVPLQDVTTRSEAVEALIVLHRQRWAEYAGGGFSDERSCMLHKHLIETLGTNGHVDMRIVRSSEGKTVGVIYNLRRNGVAYFYSIGVSQDPELSHLSLGVCLLADSIQAAIGAGCHTFDLLRGDHDYKAHFGGYTTHNLRVTIYRYGWMQKAEEMLHGLKQILRHRQTMHTATQQ